MQISLILLMMPRNRGLLSGSKKPFLCISDIPLFLVNSHLGHRHRKTHGTHAAGTQNRIVLSLLVFKNEKFWCNTLILCGVPSFHSYPPVSCQNKLYLLS